ncbi:MAG: leucine-rich repeat domain-containing protein, partial [Cyanobacteria bacterium P01_H01_bin.153]
AAPQLSKIDARFNNIASIESLENFTMLDRIYLRGNPLSAPVCPLQPTEICQFTDAEFEDSPTMELAE